MATSSSATSPPLRPSSSSSQSWDASHEAQGMLEGSSSLTNIRLLPSPPVASSSSTPLFSTTTTPGDHESFDEILANARRSTSAATVNSKSSSPLNPHSRSNRRRSSSSYVTHRASFNNVLRVPSEESRALSMHISPSAPTTRPSTPSSTLSSPANPSLGLASTPHRASMILYRLAADELGRSGSESSDGTLLAPPRFRNSTHGGAPGQRDSIVSTSGMSISGDSMVSLSSDSKYPMSASERGLVPYAYDPDEDGDASIVFDDDDGEDWMFEDEYNDTKWNEKLRASTSTEPNSSNGNTPTPTLPNEQRRLPQNRSRLWSSRGMMNISGIALLVVGLLALFIVYPVVTFYNDNGRNHRITNNARINSTGQADGDGGDVAAIPDHRGNHGVVEIVHRRDPEDDSGNSKGFDWEGFIQMMNNNAGSTRDASEPLGWLKPRFARHYD
ncbi:hypothetical protein AAF712_009862 [Marasmius tenuissimus]|uniref:Uncharacterized protein n=1 Tax=Marasmius tenuissimus TaxID=585030 RepID=A0ABR2ZPV7_9AGAR